MHTCDLDNATRAPLTKSAPADCNPAEPVSVQGRRFGDGCSVAPALPGSFDEHGRSATTRAQMHILEKRQHCM